MELTLDLINVTDQSVIRAMRHIRTQNYSAKAILKDPAKADKKVCILNIGGKVFSADSEDEISKIVLAGKQSEIYSVSFTKGEGYTDAKGVKQEGINYSNFLPKKQKQEDIKFEQDLIIESSRAELFILERRVQIKVDAKASMSMVDLEEAGA